MLDCLRCRGLVIGDPEKTAQGILKHRRGMARVPDVLPMSEDLVYEAMCDVSQHNKTVVGLSGESAAVRTALQPDYFWRVNQIRRGSAVGYHSWQLANQNRVDVTDLQYRRVHQDYPEACAGLNVPITCEEVAAVLGKLKDVEAGPDGMPLVVLRDNANHMSCPVIQSMVRYFNVVFATGVVP